MALCEISTDSYLNEEVITTPNCRHVDRMSEQKEKQDQLLLRILLACCVQTKRKRCPTCTMRMAPCYASRIMNPESWGIVK